MYYIIKESERATEFLADKKKIKGQTWINDMTLAKEFVWKSKAGFEAAEFRRDNIRVVDEEQARSIQEDMEYAGVEANYMGDE